MDVLLYRVSRNLNRAYRTCEAFGVSRLFLLECAGDVRGNLFKSKDEIVMESVRGWPGERGLLALETFFLSPIHRVDWSRVDTIVIGGETSGLPRTIKAEQAATIPMYGKISGLTVEASLAIALYEWRRNDPLTRT